MAGRRARGSHFPTFGIICNQFSISIGERTFFLPESLGQFFPQYAAEGAGDHVAEVRADVFAARPPAALERLLT